mmetsp:Transcript_132946/g.231050  ORF Transcript_132946/g.231050 Transcript_132946/m.231050 type:complete len:349 (-) Transcript_132946:299-1345(-)
MEIERVGAVPVPHVREATALEAFNAPLFEVPPMIDVRGTADFLKSHVMCAVSAPAEDGLEKPRLLQRILEHDEEFGWCLEIPLFFAVYDEVTRARASWLASILQGTVAAHAEHEGAEGTSQADKLLRRVASGCREILLLQHNDFAEAFGFCCSSGSEFAAPQFFDRVGSLPRCAFTKPRIYLAGRPVKLTPELLATLGVSHVVVNADSWDVMDSTSGGGALGPGLQDRPKDVQGLLYLKCEVPDNSDDPDIPKVLEGVARFLATCAAQGGVSLVRIHGQSRSASALCAFLMLTQGLSPQDALQTLQKAAIKVDAQLVWWDALQQLPALFMAIEDGAAADGLVGEAMCD